MHNSTLSLGNSIIHLTEATSTNDLAKQLLDEDIVEHGAFVYADFQSKGRGQEHSKWESEKGQNLLCSIVLVPAAFKADNQVYLNICIALALRDMVAAYCQKHEVFIKWPNDIYVGNQKIAGILIENSLQGSLIKHAIVGIGLNVNQQLFKDTKACSIYGLRGNNVAITDCIEQLLLHLNSRYRQLLNLEYDLLWNDYHASLYLKDIQHSFEVNKQTISGIVKGIDKAGRLLLDVNGTVKTMQVKEIKWL